MTNGLRSAPVIRTGRLGHRLARAAVTLAAVAAAAVGGVALSPGGGRTISAAGDPLGAGGEFHALAPDRIFDTRDPALDVAPPGRKSTGLGAAAVPFDVQVVGRGGLPGFVDGDGDGFDDNVLAVVATITVINPSQAGFLRAFPVGATEEDTSVVNFTPGLTVPNTAIIRPGQGGRIRFKVYTPPGTGSVDVAVDISGWFSTSSYGTRGARVRPIEPRRIYDSEQGGLNLIGPFQTVEIPVRGATDINAPGSVVVPNTPNVVGVVVNLTGVNVFPGARPTFLSLVPAPLPAGQGPSTSNLNLVPGQVRANLAILPVGTDGKIRLFNLGGSLRAAVDVMGYLESGAADSSRAGRVVPLESPFRAFDTRQPEFFAQPLGPARAEDWSFKDFVDDVTIDGTKGHAQVGLFGNLTATGLQRQYSWAPVTSFITAYPSPNGPNVLPNISNVNLAEAQSVPNLALLRYGATSEGPNRIRFFNLAGYVDYLLDVYAVVLAD
jgi:hypothetical protein